MDETLERAAFATSERPGWPGALVDGSEMGRRIADFDWSGTPLGPIGAWPQSLRAHVSLVVASSIPMYVFAGPEHIGIYNDAYATIAGNKHPEILGISNEAAWGSEVWRDLGPIVRAVRDMGRPIAHVDRMFPIARYGFVEDVFVTISYSALRDESGVASSVLCSLTETTQTVLGQRRIETLRSLSSLTADAVYERDIYPRLSDVLAENLDLPLAELFIANGRGILDRLVSVGDEDGDAGNAEPRSWPLAEAIETRAPIVVDERSGAGRGIVLPLAAADREELIGVLAVGLNPRIAFDESYRKFVALAAAQIASLIVAARALEAERKRTELLVENDRLKTAFFSNVSHEFRTPLTLMLGPIEGMLANADAHAIPESIRSDLELVHRNALRLQKLVNSLLEFSRIEAGRADARPVDTDLGAFTRGIATQFAGVMKASGIAYRVDVDLETPVAVDPEMWETIVLNLISNAFKFTFDGSISIELRRTGEHAELVVSDTGIGISQANLENVFERFHRVEAVRSRTHEGSGIGLALVRELVHLHRGDIRVESVVGRGTTFTVTLPIESVPTEAAREHGVVPEDVAQSRLSASFVDESSRWTGGRAPATAHAESPHIADAYKPHVLVADDNADMRAYVARLLDAEYRVTVVSDCAEALAAARAHPPDLLLTDVMMPDLDGFALLQTLREDPSLRAIPVILVSARAGEDSTVEALERGADDYLVKPFNARELLARVRTALALTRLRREYDREHRIANSFQQASLPLALLKIPGVALDAVYVPGSSDARVGGDWYDAMRLLDGRVVVSIGDVAGSGVAAAVIMASMRQIIRGIAQVDADPVLMLNAADRALQLEHPDIFVTAFVGVIDAVNHTLAFASAGHPPPFLRYADGRLEPLVQSGLPLGLRQAGSEDASQTIALPEGALITLYTDGLTEATRDPVAGERLLREALQSDDVALAADPARALREQILDGEGTQDDVAILTVRIDTAREPGHAAQSPVPLRWSFDASDAQSAQRARHEFGAALRANRATDADVYIGEIVFGELVGNVVRHAPGNVDVVVDWNGSRPILHVMDYGPGYKHNALLPKDIFSESGRGLFMIASLTDDFHVSRRQAGGSHARAVLGLERNRYLRERA